MADLTDIRNDIIITCPDAKSMTAFVEWEATLKTDAKANFSVVADTFVVSAPDPLGILDKTRLDFIALLDLQAESVLGVTRLRFNPDGTVAMISNRVHKPNELEEPK